MKNFFYRLSALFALAVYAPSVLGAADYAQSLFAARKTLDFYLERSRVQGDAERFKEIASLGIQASIAQWEQNTLELKMAGLEDWIFERRKFEEDLAERERGVFCQWLLERKKSESEDFEKSALYLELKELSDGFFYDDQDKGQTRIVSQEKIQDAKAQWESAAEEIVQKYLEENSSAEAEANAKWMERKILNELTSSLLYDHDSLKKLSDQSAALFVADKLSSQIEGESERSMNELFNSLETRSALANQEDIAAASEVEKNWLSRFKRELAFGLEKWSEAEVDFLRARSEWEKDAENVFAGDSQKWQEAYNELQKRKLAWSEKIQAQIEEGRRDWRERLSALDEEINRSLEDFQSALAWDVEQKKQLVQSQEEAYVQSRAILESAQRGVDIWYERWGEKYKGLYSYWKTEDNSFGRERNLSRVSSGHLKNEILVWKENFIKSLKTLAYCNLTAAEASADQISAACQLALQKKSRRPDICQEYWQCVKDGGALWNAATELFEWLDLFDCFKQRAEGSLYSLYDDFASDLEIYDELEFKKARALWILDYWKERWQIDQAALDYAQNKFSDLEWADKTERRVDEAMKACDKAKAFYQELAGMSEEKRAELLSWREAYFLALSDTELLLEKTNQEREAYDSICKERLALRQALLSDSALDLLSELQALNMSDDVFFKSLFAYCSKSEAEANERLSEEVERIRTAVEDGYDESGALGAELKKIAGGQDAQGEKSASCLSMDALERLDDSILEILASDEVRLEDGKKLLPELKKIDYGKANELESVLAACEAGECEWKKARNALLEVKALVQKETQNRLAILLLLDGGAGEIHGFFEGNDDFKEIFDRYGEWSLALLQEKSDFALERIKTLFSLGEGGMSDDGFNRLDKAAEGLNAFWTSALDLYKAALKGRDECSELETEIFSALPDFYEPLGRFDLSPLDWQLENFEAFFGGERPREELLDFDRDFFERTFFGRKEILFELQAAFERLYEISGRIKETDQELALQGAAVQKVQLEYENSLDAISADLPYSALNRYLAACQSYNDFLDECEKAYEVYEDARRKFRLAQEIYFYAQNEYLRGNYDLAAKAAESKKNLEEAQAAYDALAAIKREGAGLVLEEYKESYFEYARGKAMLYEYKCRLAEQKELLNQAQAVERKAENELAPEITPQGFSAQIPSAVQDLVLISVDKDGNYSFALNKSLATLGPENEKALKEYFSNYCLVETDVYQNEYPLTLAKREALDFLLSLEKKPYSMVDLALAEMRLKNRGGEERKNLWQKSGDNPAVDDNYKIGDLPDSIHGIKVKDEYHDERMKVLEDSYNRVLSLGGEEDLAKWILYCDSKLFRALDWESLSRNALIAAALEKPIESVVGSANTWNREAAVFFAAAAVYFVIACLPFGLGSWAAGIGAAHAAAGAAYMMVANQLFEYASDMKGVRNGAAENVRAEAERWQNSIVDWKNAVKEREERRTDLNLLLSGKKDLDGKKISWEDFRQALSSTFDKGSVGVDSSWFLSLKDGSASGGDLRSFFDEITKERDFYDIQSVMEEMTSVLQDNFSQKKSALDSLLLAREGDLSFDKAGYYKDLISFYSKDALRSIPAAMNRQSEDYVNGILLDCANLSAEALEYSARNKALQKMALCADILSDFNEQIFLWEEKNKTILSSAQIEWRDAEDKLELSFSSWKKKFELDYKNGSQEWSENYRKFLSEKNDWLMNQYLATGGQSAPSPALVPKIKARFETDRQIEAAVDSLCDSRKFERIGMAAQKLSLFSQSEFYALNLFQKMDLSLIRDFDSALKVQRQLQQSMQDAAAKGMAQEAQLQLEKSVKESFDAIQSQNQGVEKWELSMVREAGYSVDPLIHRNAISDVSALQVKREEQRVHRYEYFSPSAPAFDFDLSSCLGSTEFFIMKKVEEGRKKIQDWSESIFGSPQSQNSGGLLSEHIGKAPVFISNVDSSKSRDRNVQDWGSGQMGLILLDFQWNAIVAQAAASELAKPIYDQKLIDAGGFALPSIRDIAGIVMDIVANATGMLPLQFADDFLFGAIDVGMGYKSWGEVAEGFAKQGLMAGIASGVKWVGKALGGVLQKSVKFFQGGAGSQILGGFQNAATGYMTNAASSYVNAFDFASGKMDWETAAASWLDAGALSNAAGTFLGGSLGALNKIDANGLELSDNVFGNIRGMNGLIGNLGGQAINYLASGDFSVNLLSAKGVGLLEFGIHDGELKAGIGKGGLDLSFQSLSSFVQGAKDAAKVSKLKKGQDADQALLNASNLLARSNSDNNVSLASDLFNGKRSLMFEEGAGQFGRSDGSSIVLDKELLAQGNEGQALIAALASFQNLAQIDKNAMIDKIDFSKAKNENGQAYTEAEIEMARNKLKSDAVLDSMAEVSNVFLSSAAALGFDVSKMQNGNSIALMADAYKQGGMPAVYAIYADSERAAADKGEEKITLARLVEQPWFQNAAENRGVALGESLSKEEYNRLARQRAIDRYAGKKIQEALQAKSGSLTPWELEKIKTEARAKAAMEIVEGVANKKYGYMPEKNCTDLSGYGCTLATAAYIAYSISGKVGTLAEANEIVKENDLFVYQKDQYGLLVQDENEVSEKNMIGRGIGYVNAVNAIAGGNYLGMDGRDYSVEADIYSGNKKIDNRQKIFDRILTSSKNQDDVYFVHMRVNGSHSVLFDSLSYKDENDYKSSKLSVMDPWQGGKYGPKSWADISRADFYKLTQSGKDIYNLTKTALRSAA